MKRFLSLVLTLVMCLSVFSATAAEVYAAASADSIFTISDSGFSNGKITYTISLKAGIKGITGAIFNIKYDSKILEVADTSGPAGAYDSDGNFEENIAGIYVKGGIYNNENEYGIGFVNSNGVSVGAADKEFVKVTFEACSEERPYTDIEFFCTEFSTNDSDSENNIEKTDTPVSIGKFTVFTLSPAVNGEVASAANDSLKFTWSAGAGAEYYDVYRKTATEDWALIATLDGDVTEYVDGSIKKGIEYFYSVATRNFYGSLDYDKTGVSGFYFGTVTELNAKIVENGIEVSWSELDGAESYAVYRNTDGSGWKKLATVSSPENTYKDTSVSTGKNYEYTVKAYRGSYVAEATVEPASVDYITAPLMNYAYGQINYDDIVINWSTVSGAVGYKVYRKADGESDYSFVGQIEGNAYTDKDVVAGKTYSYKVVSIGSRQDSLMSKESCDVIKLSITDNVEAKLGTNRIIVSWSPVSPVESYQVWRKTIGATGSSWTRITSVDGSKTEYADRAVSEGKVYAYAVSTLYGEYLTEISNVSNEVHYMSSPEITSVENVSDGLNIVFSTVKSAESYNIYRKDIGGDFTLLTNVADGNSYIDTTVVSGKKYIYGVSAVNSGTQSPIAETEPVCKLEQPVLTYAKAENDGVTLKWTAVTGAEKYVITAGNTKIAEVDASELSYIVSAPTAGVPVVYGVYAACGISTSASATESIIYLVAPKVQSATNAANGISLQYSKVDGADSYNIYRKEPDGTYALIEKAVSGTTYSDKTAVSGQKYVYAVSAVSGSTESTKGESDTVCRLAQPKITAASAVYGGVSIKWESVDGAEKYIIYHGKTKSEKNKIAEVKAGVTSYKHTAAVNERNNFYYVQAVSGDTVSVQGASGGIWYIEAPKISSRSNVSGGVKIVWNSLGDDYAYRVYRKAAGDKSWTNLTKSGDITKTTYTDKTVKSGTEYYYTVRAVESDGTLSPYHTTGWKIKYLATPTVKATVAYNSVSVSWGKITGAKSYTVYRKTAGSSWQSLKTGVTGTSYTDKTAKSGTTYYYTVRALADSYISSYDSKGAAVKYIASPSVSVSNATSGVTVKWSKITGAKSYIVYRKTTSAKSWSRLATTTSASYTDKTAKSGTTYLYTVRATDGKVYSGYNTSGWKIKFLAVPNVSGLTASKGKIAVKWAKTTGASQYEVYRKAGSGSWTKVATVKSSASYTDKSVKKGTTYAYKVRAVSGSTRSAFGTTKSVKAK